MLLSPHLPSMAPPRSPTHAFDPTPALEHNLQNYTPLNDLSNGQKEVHFSDHSFVMPQGARHSIATTDVPLLSGVSSSSQIPRQSFRISGPSPNIDINAYIENCRNLNQQLRQAHDTERKAWDIERSSLQARIADLEFRLSKARDPKRRASNDSSGGSAQSFRSDFNTLLDSSNSSVSSRKFSESSAPSAPPCWQGPESTPPVARVFSNEHSDEMQHLPSISEDEPFPSLSKEISPTSKEESRPVPAEQIDKNLDGITLKSTGLTSSFVAKITSPQFNSPARSPSPRAKETPKHNNLQVSMSSLMSPLDEKLKRNAGHTPMAFSGDMSISADVSTGIPTPTQEHPPDPAPTAKRPSIQPTENSDSYFSFTSDSQPDGPTREKAEEVTEPDTVWETQDDSPLKAPLMLDPSANSQAANSFLDQVDQKLMEAASSSHSRFRADSVLSSELQEGPGKDQQHGIGADAQTIGNGNNNASNEQARPTSSGIDDGGPRLKMKKSMNFGSAWGGGFPGRV